MFNARALALRSRNVACAMCIDRGNASMMLRDWARVGPLCALLLTAAACGDDEDDGGDQVEDGGEVADDADASGEREDDAGAPSEDAGEAIDASAAKDDAGTSAQDAAAGDAGSSKTDASTGSDAGVELDQDGIPILPAGKTNVIFLSVSESRSNVLGDGTYQAPFSPNASSPSTLTYLDNSYIFTMQPSLQVQMNLQRMMKDGSFECKSGSEVLVRYGKPPSGSNQLYAKSCSVKYQYDAAKTEYTGTIEAEMGDGLTSASDEAAAKISARFTVIGSNK
jgi:hypothetical protein